MRKPKVVIMYLLWDQEPQRYLADAIDGVKKQTYDHDDIEFLIVYNSHKPENESACPYIREQIAKHQDDLPHVTILEQQENLGFSGGNNLGMQWGIDHGFDYVFLHNGDGYLGSDCIAQLVKHMQEDNVIGASQALMLLHPDTDKINSAGNNIHFLGLGYCDLYTVPKADTDLPQVKDVGYLSGGAIMMRTDLLREYGLWDKDYFMYHEDTDYSFRLKIHGYRTVLISDAEFFHKYEFSKSIAKYYWMERNRHAFMLLFFKWPTLLLLAPMSIVFELALILYSLKGGWFRERLRVYAYWLNPSNWKLWLKKRARIQQERVVDDRVLVRSFVSIISFQEPGIQNPILTYIGNPMMTAYWFVVKRLIWW